jgi:hypothetical protein
VVVCMEALSSSFNSTRLQTWVFGITPDIQLLQCSQFAFRFPWFICGQHPSCSKKTMFGFRKHIFWSCGIWSRLMRMSIQPAVRVPEKIWMQNFTYKFRCTSTYKFICSNY